MEPLMPSSQPLGIGSEASPACWDEYKRLYERYLDQRTRTLEQQDQYNRLQEEYNRILAAHLQLEKEEARRKEQQTRMARWLGFLLGFCLIGFSVALLVRSLLAH